MKPITTNFVKAQLAKLRFEHPDFDEDEFLLSVESETDAVEMMERLIRRIKETEAIAGGLQAYKTEIQNRIEDLDRRVERMKETVLSIMQAAERTSMPLQIATLSTRVNYKVIVTNATEIPQIYRRQPPWEPMKDIIRARLRAGAVVPGCELSNGIPSIQIRMK